MAFFVFQNLNPKRKRENLAFRSTTKSKTKLLRLRFGLKKNLNPRLRFGPVNEEKSLVYLMFFESPFFLFVFVLLCSLSIRWSNQQWVEKQHHSVVVRERFFWREKKQLQLFGAKNDCFFFGGTSKDKIDDQAKFILKRMKVSYDRYETLLHAVLL